MTKYYPQKNTASAMLKPKQAKAVRWLSHDQACETMQQIYPCVLLSLKYEAEERDDPKAIGLLKQMEDWSFLACLNTLCDILPALASMSRNFQVCYFLDIFMKTLTAFSSRNQPLIFMLWPPSCPSFKK